MLLFNNKVFRLTMTMLFRKREEWGESMDYNVIKDMLAENTQNGIFHEFPCGIFCGRYVTGRGNENLQALYTNETFFECIGYRPEEFEATGRDILAIVVKSEREKAKQQISDAISRENEIILQNYRIRRPDNGINHIFCSLKSEPGVQGQHMIVAVYMNVNQILEKERIVEEWQERMLKISSKISYMIKQMPSGCAVISGGEVWELHSGNEEFFTLGGYTIKEIQAMPNDIYDIVYRLDVRKLRRAAEEALRGGETKECEIRIYNKQGKIRWQSIKLKFYCYQNGKPYYLVSSWDIHERKLMEEELCLQSERYKLLEEINKEIRFEFDVRNQKFLIFETGKEQGEHIIPREEMAHFIHPEDNAEFQEIIDRASAEPEEGSMEYRINIALEGEEVEYIWYRTIYKSIKGVGGRVVRILGRTEDISVQKMKHNEMAQQLQKDCLTGILNKSTTRSFIEEFLKEEPQGEHAFFLIDIDNFKAINDTFGHLFGDSVLVNISEKLKGLFRSSDIVGRIGGDEFIAFMKHTSAAQARIKAQSICDVVKQDYNGMNGQIEISCSVGVALYGEEREEYTALFAKADIAMYQAKKKGKNQYSIAKYADPAWKIQKGSGIDRRLNQYRAGRDFLTEAFLLLSHAKDANNSLNMLLERIGREYNLGIVVMFEENIQEDEVDRSNAWYRKRGILPKKKFSAKSPEWKEYIRYFGNKEIACIRDCFLEDNVTDTQRMLFEEKDVRAIVSCSFSYSEWRKGYIIFSDTERVREWSEFEQNELKELAHLLSVFSVVRRQQEEEHRIIRQLKKKDDLTGLYNEQGFMEQVREKIKNWKENIQYAIVYSDINDFSYINDNYGYDAGNEILKSMAAQIGKEVQSVSCRLYSDVFIRFLWDKDKDAILHRVVTENMNFCNGQKKKYETENIKLSTGIYFLEDPEEKLEIAIENANLTRKSIKKSGSVYYRVYEKKLRQKREDEKRIIEGFQETLREGRIEVYIQPKFQLKDKKIFGGEALVRWRTPKGKIEYPDNFIPTLEKSGHIVILDFYVYENVLKIMRKWKEEGKELPVISVNFSRKHFETGGIYSRVVEMADTYGIPHACIEIEITESLFTTRYNQVIQEMQKFRKSGFKVAIDDFGTGYSSLSMLLDIPIDIVKIDKGFLRGRNRKNGRDFIENLGRLICSMEEQVIFEGIETEEQCKFLVECGFEYGQGFLFERPIPIPVFEEKYMK